MYLEYRIQRTEVHLFDFFLHFQRCMFLQKKHFEMNVRKLEARYPGGEFDVHKSENRVEGDL